MACGHDTNAGARHAEPVVSVVVPTVGRSRYLDVALSSLAGQDATFPYEIVVVADGCAERTASIAARHGARIVEHARRRSVNAARNTGAAVARADLIAFVDDDVWAPPAWLRGVVEGASRHREADVLAGPIRPRFEGRPPRGCGRDAPLITCLDLGEHDRPTATAWGANMAVRRRALSRAGAFDEAIVEPCGDEEEWLARLRARGGRIVYVAAAGLDHRRSSADVRLARLSRAAFRRGIAARAFDRRRGVAPGVARELVTLAGCIWHTVRRGCPRGLVMGSHAAGRVVAASRGE